MTEPETATNAPEAPHVVNQLSGIESRMQRLLEQGFSARAADAAARIDDTMTQIRRSIARREILQQAIVDLKIDADINHLTALYVISGMRNADDETHEVTVGFLAEKLAIDPSRASRLAAEMVEKGLAERVASQADARRICLVLTARGRAYHEALLEYKAWIFAEALLSWDEDELVDFANQFSRFSLWVAENKKHASTDTEHLAKINARLREI